MKKWLLGLQLSPLGLLVGTDHIPSGQVRMKEGPLVQGEESRGGGVCSLHVSVRLHASVS